MNLISLSRWLAVGMSLGAMSSYIDGFNFPQVMDHSLGRRAKQSVTPDSNIHVNHDRNFPF